MNLFKLFKKEIKQSIQITDLDIGMFIEINYKDPKTVGIINPNTLTCTRLNHDEINNRNIKGFIVSKYFDKNIRVWFLGVRACKKNGNEIIERDFLFLDNEIENIRILK